jgi:hypothetical protein
MRKLLIALVLTFSLLALAFPQSKVEATCIPQCLGCEYKKASCETYATWEYNTCLNTGGYTAICWMMYYDTYTACVWNAGC